MNSWEVLEPRPLRPGGIVTNAFLKTCSVADFRSAGRFVRSLPYGRNTDTNDALVVLAEERGTCSTKHALIRRLAVEQGLNVALMIGIYEMTDLNTAGVGAVLTRYKLHALPEAHCYLKTVGARVDVTRATERRTSEEIMLLHEEEIEATQIGPYKVDLHKQFLSRWVEEQALKAYTMEELWCVREECIAALEGVSA